MSITKFTMVSHDYTKEVGLSSGQKTISKPLAAIILIALAIGGWYVVRAASPARQAKAPQETSVAAK